MHAFAFQDRANPLSIPSVQPAPPRITRKPIAFRHFVALPSARTLLLRGMPVELGGRAFDLLLVLLRARGTIVGKDQLMREVWPDIFVDHGNLRFQMATLRKALGEDRDLIKTVTGRGYLLIDESEEPRAGQPPRRPVALRSVQSFRRTEPPLRFAAIPRSVTISFAIPAGG